MANSTINSNLMKYVDIQYSVSNSDSSKYYIILDNNILQSIGNGATTIFSWGVTNFSGFSIDTISGDGVLPTNLVVHDNTLQFLFKKGKTLANCGITVRYCYK